MSTQPIQQMTLREKLKRGEQLCRELADHLERGFAPKAKSLGNLFRPVSDEATSEGLKDKTVYLAADAVLDSHQFSGTIAKQLQEFLAGIDESVSQIVDE